MMDMNRGACLNSHTTDLKHISFNALISKHKRNY